MATSGQDAKATTGQEGKPAEEAQKKKGGFFSSVGGAFNKMGKEIEKGVDSASKKIDESWKSDLLSHFRTNMQVQLISVTSGKALQHCAGKLDVCGPPGNDDDKKCSTWTVLNGGNNIIRLHNENCYLAIVDGATVVVAYADPATTGPETQLRLQQTGNFIMLESVKEPKCHVGCLEDGSLKPALVCSKEEAAKFGVKVIYSPYPPPQK